LKLRFEKITTFDDFMNLKADWNRLVKSTEIDHAFMRHEWFESWIKNLMPKGKLAIHTAWDNNKLVAIAPLQITREIRKRIPLKLLSFLRSSVTPRSNFIIDSSIDPAPFFDSVFATRGWKIAELKALELNAGITGKLIAYLKQTKRFVIEHGLQSPYEIIETDWDTFLKSRSEGLRKNYRNSLNRLKKAQSYEIVRIEDGDTFARYFDAIVEISARSWKREGGTDLQSMPEMASFFKDFCALTSADGFFLSNVLVLEDKPVAFDYYLKFGNRLVALRWEYDQDFNYYMPGTLLHNNVIKTILDTGQSLELDLSGMVTEHKKHIANDIRRHIDITLEAPGVLGGLIMYFKKVSMRSEDITEAVGGKSESG
jgi:CelD/BcsL family acetyltransferase involved in cellulose biosynthesis